MEKKNETVHKDPIPRLSATLKKKTKKTAGSSAIHSTLATSCFYVFYYFFFTGFYRILPSFPIDKTADGVRDGQKNKRRRK